MPDFMSDLARLMLASSATFNARSLSTLYPYTKSEDVIVERNRGWLKAYAREQAARAGFFRVSKPELQAQQDALAAVAKWADGLDHTYQLLADDYSRRILVEVMAYRILGPARVRLSRNNDQYAAFYDAAKRMAVQERTATIAMLDGWLDRYDLNALGYPVGADLHHLSVLYTFQLEQYRYKNAGTNIGPRANDVAIDGGACWGDTALYFAHHVGEGGQVHTFEFSPDNLPILAKNLGGNPELGKRVKVQEYALWSHSGEHLCFDPQGPATRLDSRGSTSVETLSIDDLVSRESLPRVDFIKMDIEGAEPEALKGALATLQKFRPRLAVTLYHNLSDFVTIPRFLDELNLGYKFYIDHFSIKREETVMFAESSPT
jgi:FkbM family methyltransferase